MNLSYGKLRLAIVFVVFFVMGVGMMITSTSKNSKAANATQDFNYMSASEFTDGMYVKGKVYEIWDEFAYEETYDETLGFKHNERVTSHYYVVPMAGTYESETPMFVAVEISHVGMIAEAEKLMQQTWDYMDYGTEPEVWNEFDIVGEVKPLEGELLDYFYEWFMYGDESATRAEYSQYICPYIITYYNVGGGSSLVTSGAVIAIIGAVGAAIIIVITLKGRQTVNMSEAPVQYPEAGSYNPVSGSSGTVTSARPQTAEDMELMKAMEKLSQPANNADDFFGMPSRPAAQPAPEPEKKPEPAPAPVSMDMDSIDMDGIDTSVLGVGIADDE